ERRRKPAHNCGSLRKYEIARSEIPSSRRQVPRQSREKLLAVSPQVEVTAGKYPHCEHRRGLDRPSFQVLAAHVRIFRSAIGANRTIERRFLGVDVIAVDRGVLPQSRQNQLHEIGIVEHFARRSFQAPQRLHELRFAGFGRRHMSTPELGRACARSHQHAGRRLISPPQQARQLERHYRAHAVSEECEWLVQMGLDGVAQRRYEFGHGIPPRRAHWYHRNRSGQGLRPSSVRRASAAGVREAKEPQRACRNVPGAGDPAQPQRQEFAAIRGEAIHRIAVAGGWWLVTGGCATSIGQHLLQQRLERSHAQACHIGQRRLARCPRKLVVMRAIRMPPILLAITGTPRSMASTTIRDRASAHNEGTNSTRVRRRMSSTLSTGSSSVTFARLASAARSAWVVPQVGTPANRTWGMRSASSRKIEMPFTAHGFTSVTNSFSKWPRSG